MSNIESEALLEKKLIDQLSTQGFSKVTIKDENDLLEKFMLFLQKQEEYVSRAKENAEIVRKKYSIEKHIENLKEVYLSLHWMK